MARAGHPLILGQAPWTCVSPHGDLLGSRTGAGEQQVPAH